MKISLYQAISDTLQAKINSEKSGNDEWVLKHGKRLGELAEYLPSGAGLDNGTRLDKDASKPPTKLVFNTSFHHMDEKGFYDGWTEHRVTVQPTFDGINVTVSGSNRNDVRDDIAQRFYELADVEVNRY